MGFYHIQNEDYFNMIGIIDTLIVKNTACTLQNVIIPHNILSGSTCIIVFVMLSICSSTFTSKFCVNLLLLLGIGTGQRYI